MRTLTKERVNLPGLADDSSGTLSLDLIGDSSNEVICRKLANLQEANKKALALAKQENMAIEEQRKRRGYAQMFISRYIKMFNISRENMKDLVKELKDEDIFFLENTVLEKLKKPAILQVVGSLAGITFIGCGLGAFLLGDGLLGDGLLGDGLLGDGALFFLSTLIGLSVIPIGVLSGVLRDFFWGASDNNPFQDNHAAYYIGEQRIFKDKYGPNYFPYQEVKEELGLTEKVNRE